MGTVSLTENLIAVRGGAIAITAVPGTTVLLQDILFDRNAVEVPMDGRTVDITVLLYTGPIGIGTFLSTEADFLIPIWRKREISQMSAACAAHLSWSGIDDGPVYGVPFEMCQAAQEHSDRIVDLGYEPSWPGLACANVTHEGPERSYSQTVTVTQGQHTLWAGTLVMVRI